MPTLMKKLVILQSATVAEQANALIDTGASFSFVQEALAVKLGGMSPLPQVMMFTLGDGNRLQITHGITLSLMIDGMHLLDTFLVLPGDGVEQVVLGATTLRKFGLKVDVAKDAVYAALTLNDTTINVQEVPMSEKLKALLLKLGIEVTDAMTEDQALAVLEAKATAKPATAPASLAVLAMLGLAETATEPQVKGKIMALQHRADVVPAEQFNQLQANLHDRDIRDTVDSALREGKITPAERVWADSEARKDLPAFQAFLAERPKVVPVGTKLPDAPTQQQHQAKVGDNELAIFAQLGVTVEQVANANPKVA